MAKEFKIFVGTSGFSYHHWIENFYPPEVKESEWLDYYSRFFRTVEINSSFYRLPEEKTFDSWFKRTPNDFVFSVKGSRFITHTKRLLVDQNSVELFIKRSKALSYKLEVILWQLPPGFKINLERLNNFLKLISKYKYRFAFEFRDESWFNPEVYELFKHINAALVIADSPEFPGSEVRTADFSYLRFHGGKYLYSSKYSPKEMEKWSEKIRELAIMGDVYAYFNNDANAYAVKNALELKKKMK